MSILTCAKARMRMLGALACTVALAAVAVTANPAEAALTGTDWKAQKLPPGYFLDAHTPFAPISCVRHTTFCMTITNDSANPVPIKGTHMTGEAVLVSTDAGQTWTGYDTLPSPLTFYRALSISCFSASACGVAGLDVHGQPAVIFTADGGRTWADPTPAAWEDVSWQDTSISCVSATACWDHRLRHAGRRRAGALHDADREPRHHLEDHHQSPGPHVEGPARDLRAEQHLLCLRPVLRSRRHLRGGQHRRVRHRHRDQQRRAHLDAAGVPARPHVADRRLLRASLLIPTCFASGAKALGSQDAGSATVVVSRDGGMTWSVRKVFAGAGPGYFSPVSCADARHCWTAWGGSALALAGTADAGASWSTVNSDLSSEYGYVSCLSVSTCVATTDQGLWVTSDDGGLRG